MSAQQCGEDGSVALALSVRLDLDTRLRSKHTVTKSSRRASLVPKTGRGPVALAARQCTVNAHQFIRPGRGALALVNGCYKALPPPSSLPLAPQSSRLLLGRRLEGSTPQLVGSLSRPCLLFASLGAKLVSAHDHRIHIWIIKLHGEQYSQRRDQRDAHSA